MVIVILGIVALSFVPAQSPQELSSAAAAAMRDQDYQAAAENYERLLQLAPDAAEIHSNLGLARYFQKKLEPAEKAFQEALRRNSRLFVPNFFLGRLYFETGRNQSALPLLQEALELQPHQEAVHRYLAAVLVGLDRFDDAIAQYQGLLEKNPDDIESLYSLGLVFLDLGQKAFDRLSGFEDSGFVPLVTAEFYAERPDWQTVTIGNYRQAVIASPGVPGLRIALGMFLLKAGDWDAARQAFEEELKLDPLSYEARFGISVFHLFKGDLQAALGELNEAVRIRPQFFDPLPPLPVDLASEHLPADYSSLKQKAKQGDFGAAYLLTELSAHVSRPDHTVSWRALAEKRRDQLIHEYQSSTRVPAEFTEEDRRSLGLQSIREKRYEDGLHLLLPVGAGVMTNPQIRTPLLRTLFRLERFENLLDLLAGAKLNDPEVFYVLGSSYRKLALQTLQKIVELDPESARAHQLLGDALFAQKLFQEAAAEYETAAGIEPGSAALLFSLGNAYFEQLEFERTAQVYQRVLELDPFHAEAHFMQGSCLLRLGRPQEAVLLLRRALQLQPDLIGAHAALGRALATLGRTEKAIEHLELGADSDTDGSIHYQLFNLYRKLGQEEKAKSALRTSQKLRSASERQGMFLEDKPQQ